MADLRVQFLHPTDGRSITVTLDGTMTGSEAVAELISNDFVSRTPQGYDYILTVKGTGTVIKSNESFEQAGVKDHDSIRIVPLTKKGDAPDESITIINSLRGDKVRISVDLNSTVRQIIQELISDNEFLNDNRLASVDDIRELLINELIKSYDIVNSEGKRLDPDETLAHAQINRNDTLRIISDPISSGYVINVSIEKVPGRGVIYNFSVPKGEMSVSEKENNSGNSNSKSSKQSILFLASDPTDEARLRLGQEAREIQEKLKLAKLRERFVFYQKTSIRPEDISQALLDVQPRIVHFSGHGISVGALCFENETGQRFPVEAGALSALFEQFSCHVNCVVLNACYSEVQGKAIVEHIEYVVGMKQAIDDKAAIAFSIGFYQALGAGTSIEGAYKLGCVQMRLQGCSEQSLPVLLRRNRNMNN